MPCCPRWESWPVISYVVTDVATGTPIVLNVTQPGHPLFPGVVARYTSGTPGNYTVNNVGEGTAAIESGWNPFRLVTHAYDLVHMAY